MSSVIRLACLISWLLSSVSGLIYIDNVIQESDNAVLNLSVTYNHNAAGNSVTNVTLTTFLTIFKMMIYFTIKTAENQENLKYDRELVKTVIDTEKLFKGSQANPLVKAYFDSVKRNIDFKTELPMLPGTYKIRNVVIDTAFLSFLQDTRGFVDYRIVGRYGSSKKMRYMAHLAFSGGYRHE